MPNTEVQQATAGRNPRRENRAYESTPPHSGQKPRLPERQTWLQSTKTSTQRRRSARERAQTAPNRERGVLRTATTRSTRPPADATQGQNVNIRRATAASRGEGGAANSHRQTVNVGHPWAATRRRERRCRNSHREIRAQESTPPHSGRKPGPSVRLTWLLAPERPQRDARAKT